MRNRLLLPVALLCCLVFAACQQTEPAKTKIAVVDMPRLLNESELGKAGIVYLENLQKELQDKLNDLQNKLSASPDDENLQNEVRTAFMSFRGRMEKETQNVTASIGDVLQKVIEEYRAKNGYDQIFTRDAVVAYDPKQDITSLVMTEVNKQKLTFKPLEEDTDSDADAADAAEAEKPAEQADKPAATSDKPAGKKDEGKK